jgi:hypothetical protein
MTQDNEDKLTQILEILSKEGHEQGVDMLGQIFIMLKGNGDPKNGIVWKVDQLYDWMEKHEEAHCKAEAEKDEQKLRTDARKWDIVRGIIMWIVPAVVMWLANVLANTP